MTFDTAAAADQFPRTSGRRKGYDAAAVDAFLAAARAAFEDGGDDVDSSSIRRAAFSLVRGGYDVDAVDSALGRIEDAFAARERGEALAQAGARGWLGRSRRLGQEVLDRLTRPAKHRFDRAGVLRFGYRIDEVDVVADKIAAFLETGEGVTVDQVRSVAFRMQRRGYREDQVDAVLDAVVEVMLAVR